ncbi:MAG: transaldolase [Acidobacteria bacterium]|nr:transaldolase [Acidobacteriota bacterium]
MDNNTVSRIQALGQSVWIDYIRRSMLITGELGALVRQGITGLTSNPTIFEKAISGSTDYDEALLELSRAGRPPAQVFEALAVKDIQDAADILRGVYDRTDGADGYASIELPPPLAHDRRATVSEGRRLFAEVGRPNVLIKVPATPEGIPAIEYLLAAGVNVNITLMFSLAHYEAVAQAYLRGLARAKDPARVASVASFFVSRVDTKIDPLLEANGSEAALLLKGSIGIANSKATYARYREIFEGDLFSDLEARGARPQRVLWASTSTKNPAYRDVFYVEELIGPNTVNTIPPKTLEAFRDHGEGRSSLLEELDTANQRLASFADLGFDLGVLTEELQSEGVDKFVQPFDSLLGTLTVKRDALLAA